VSNTEDNDPIEELLAEAEKTVQLAEKKKLIEQNRTEKAYQLILKEEEDKARLSNVDILAINPKFIEKMDQDHEMTVQSMKDRLPFVNPTLTDLVPFSFPNLLFIGAKTGSGKTSFTSAAVLTLLRAGKKVLVISNEELAANYYNRVLCLNKGWNINRMKEFTPEQHEELRRLRTQTYETGRLNVIDSDFADMKGATSTLEGMKLIFEKLYEIQLTQDGKCPYHAIFVDYFQNCGTSINNSRMRKHEVLEELTKFLDTMYKKLHAPITVLGQIKPESKDETDLEFRIKDSRSIYVPATFALELQPDKAKSSTRFIVHKHRWSSRAGESIELGFDRGHFVEYTMAFQEKVLREAANREHAQIMKPLIERMDNKEEK
jgi:hypothetical protein